MSESKVCSQCSKPPTETHLLAPVILGDETYLVCGQQAEFSFGGSRPGAPRKGCLGRLLASKASKVCANCGGWRYYSSEEPFVGLCRGCLGKLEQAERLLERSPESTLVATNVHGISLHLKGWKDAERLHQALVDGFAEDPGAAVSQAQYLPQVQKAEFCFHPGQERIATGWVWKVPVARVFALQTLLEVVYELVNMAYEKGLEEGSSALLKLASGDMSINDFNDKTMRGGS